MYKDQNGEWQSFDGNEMLRHELEWQTKVRGTDNQEYQIYLDCADNGKGGDITRNGAPLLSFDEWIKQ